ncbi:MAG: hypothetical protein ACREQ9_09095 [Candidatus Binatia bacterium]
MDADRAPSFRIAGEAGRGVADQVRARLAEHRAKGLIDPEEVERISRLELRIFAGDGVASEVFRRCCMTWDVDPAPPITSHRPVVGVALVALKRLVRRALRFQTEAQFVRQRDFNWNLLLVLRDLLEKNARER